MRSRLGKLDESCVPGVMQAAGSQRSFAINLRIFLKLPLAKTICSYSDGYIAQARRVLRVSCSARADGDCMGGMGLYDSQTLEKEGGGGLLNQSTCTKP